MAAIQIKTERMINVDLEASWTLGQHEIIVILVWEVIKNVSCSWCFTSPMEVGEM